MVSCMSCFSAADKNKTHLLRGPPQCGSQETPSPSVGLEGRPVRSQRDPGWAARLAGACVFLPVTPVRGRHPQNYTVSPFKPPSQVFPMMGSVSGRWCQGLQSPPLPTAACKLSVIPLAECLRQPSTPQAGGASEV